MPGHLIKTILFSALLSISITGNEIALAAPGAKKPAEGEEAKKKGKARLSQRRFYTMQPFTVPLLADGKIDEQFTIVLSIELVDEEDRVDITYAMPRIRNEMYNELLHLVTFRRKGSTIPQIAIFKRQLLKVTQRVMGEKVKSLVIQQAFKGNTR